MTIDYKFICLGGLIRFFYFVQKQQTSWVEIGNKKKIRKLSLLRKNKHVYEIVLAKPSIICLYTLFIYMYIKYLYTWVWRGEPNNEKFDCNLLRASTYKHNHTYIYNINNINWISFNRALLDLVVQWIVWKIFNKY